MTTMLEYEAREWIARVRKEGHSRHSGQRRLNGILSDIEAKRGKPAADELRGLISAELAKQRRPIEAVFWAKRDGT